MNNASVLCRYLSEHPNWMEELTDQYQLKIKTDGPYAIFNYNSGCDFADPIVQEARGIILDTETLQVVCWPFRKFGNYYESYADPIDWSTARVQEKVDGSIIKLWFDPRAAAWTFSTNGMIHASEAPLGEASDEKFLSVIQSAVNYPDLDFERLNRDYTYIFELVSPRITVVVRYDQPMLVHTGTRNRITGQELETDIQIRKPASYPLHSMEDCLTAAEQLNKGLDGAVEKEGFVVVDANWHRVKIKSPDYLITHRIVENGTWNMRRVLEQIWEEKRDVSYLCRLCPDDARIFMYYAYQLEELAWQCDQMADYARGLSKEAEGDRKAVARVISSMPLSAPGFWALNHQGPGRRWMDALQVSALMKLIPEYTNQTIFAPKKETGEEG